MQHGYRYQSDSDNGAEDAEQARTGPTEFLQRSKDEFAVAAVQRLVACNSNGDCWRTGNGIRSERIDVKIPS
jgi:hypothetical protein